MTLATERIETLERKVAELQALVGVLTQESKELASLIAIDGELKKKSDLFNRMDE